MKPIECWTREDLIDYCTQTNCRECDSKVKAFCDSICDNLTSSSPMPKEETAKPLKDWTLEEAHNYCIGYRFSHKNNCVGCKLFKQCRHSFGSFDFIPPTQEETIVWHKYPEDKPTQDKQICLTIDGNVSYDSGISKPSAVFHIYDADNAKFVSNDNFITCWAEMPKGYKDEKSTSLFDVNTYEGSIVDPPLKCNCAEYDVLQEMEKIYEKR